jgi:hypothetical protein
LIGFEFRVQRFDFDGGLGLASAGRTGLMDEKKEIATPAVAWRVGAVLLVTGTFIAD